MRPDLPPAFPGQVIGLLGGSFDPAHAGHVNLTRQALARFGLTHVWWMVSPGNPLKRRGPAALELRMQTARHVMQHPRVTITDLEARIGTRYTADTLAAVLSRNPATDFVWVMGADNLTGFHRCRNWRAIAAMMPIAVVDRPGS